MAENKMFEIILQPAADIQKNEIKNDKLVPWNEITNVGGIVASLATLAEPFRTIEQTTEVATSGIFRVTDAAGNALGPSQLQAFKDGSGYLGSTYSPTAGFSQARLNEVTSLPVTSTTTIPIDPMTLAITAALAEINMKLDDIQETQKEIFDFMKRDKESKLTGSIKSLSDIFQLYPAKCMDKGWLYAASSSIVNIQKQARQDIDFYTKDTEEKLNKKNPLYLSKDVNEATNKAIESLNNYQMAMYSYSFASFLEILISKNFAQNNLDSTAHLIEGIADEYETLLNKCRKEISSLSQGSAQQMLLGGMSFVTGNLGKAIEKTPVGKHTLIDEALLGAQNTLDEVKYKDTRKKTKKLRQARNKTVRPFVEGIKGLNESFNKPNEYLIGEKGIYIHRLPEASSED